MDNKRTATSQKNTKYFSVPSTKKHKPTPTDDEVAIANNLSDSKKVSY